ncbi:hypothetical protein ACKVMT_07760 [Halobacteriales archaeon Cl-PHB]
MLYTQHDAAAIPGGTPDPGITVYLQKGSGRAHFESLAARIRNVVDHSPAASHTGRRPTG